MICWYVDYDWDDDNTNHLADHKIKPAEFEEVMRNDPRRYKEEVHGRSGELRFTEIGHTNGLRILFVVWTLRDNRIRPVTAWPAKHEDREEYLTQYYEEGDF